MDHRGQGVLRVATINVGIVKSADMVRLARLIEGKHVDIIMLIDIGQKFGGDVFKPLIEQGYRGIVAERRQSATFAKGGGVAIFVKWDRCYFVDTTELTPMFNFAEEMQRLGHMSDEEAVKYFSALVEAEEKKKKMSAKKVSKAKENQTGKRRPRTTSQSAPPFPSLPRSPWTGAHRASWYNEQRKKSARHRESRRQQLAGPVAAIETEVAPAMLPCEFKHGYKVVTANAIDSDEGIKVCDYYTVRVAVRGTAAVLSVCAFYNRPIMLQLSTKEYKPLQVRMCEAVLAADIAGGDLNGRIAGLNRYITPGRRDERGLLRGNVFDAMVQAKNRTICPLNYALGDDFTNLFPDTTRGKTKGPSKTRIDYIAVDSKLFSCPLGGAVEIGTLQHRLVFADLGILACPFAVSEAKKQRAALQRASEQQTLAYQQHLINTMERADLRAFEPTNTMVASLNNSMLQATMMLPWSGGRLAFKGPAHIRAHDARVELLRLAFEANPADFKMWRFLREAQAYSRLLHLKEYDRVNAQRTPTEAYKDSNPQYRETPTFTPQQFLQHFSNLAGGSVKYADVLKEQRDAKGQFTKDEVSEMLKFFRVSPPDWFDSQGCKASTDLLRQPHDKAVEHVHKMINNPKQRKKTYLGRKVFERIVNAHKEQDRSSPNVEQLTAKDVADLISRLKIDRKLSKMTDAQIAERVNATLVLHTTADANLGDDPVARAVYNSVIEDFAVRASRMLDSLKLDEIASKQDVEKHVAPLQCGVDAPRVELEELNAAIEAFNGDSCLDIFKIGPWHVKHWPQAVRIRVAQIFTSVLRSREIPSKFKETLVVPVPKGDIDRDMLGDVTKWRPVAVTPTISRLLEHVVLRRMESRMMSQVAAAQVGSQAGRSSGFVVEHFIATVDKALNTSECNRGNSNGNRNPHCKRKVVMLHLDAKNAFGSITHSSIIDALTTHGFDPYITHFVQNWLRDRPLSARVGESVSSASGRIVVNRGGPQGSVLMPWLFALTINKFIATANDRIRSPMVQNMLNKAVYVKAGDTKWCFDELVDPEYKSRTAKPATPATMSVHAVSDDIVFIAEGQYVEPMVAALRMVLDDAAMKLLSDVGITISSKSTFTLFHAACGAKRTEHKAVDEKYEFIKLGPSGPKLPLVQQAEARCALLGITLNPTVSGSVIFADKLEKFEAVVRNIEAMTRCTPAQRQGAYKVYGIGMLSSHAPLLLRSRFNTWADKFEDLHVRACRAVMRTACTAGREECVTVAGFKNLRSELTERYATLLAAMSADRDPVIRATATKAATGVETNYVPLAAAPHEIAKAQRGAIKFYTDQTAKKHLATHAVLKTENANRVKRARDAFGTSVQNVVELATDGAFDPLSGFAAGAYNAKFPNGKERVTNCAINLGSRKRAKFSAWSAELAAALLGLQKIVDYAKMKEGVGAPFSLLWLCDSKSLLTSLQKSPMRQRNPHLRRVWNMMMELVGLGWRIACVFQFSHVGSAANSAVDAAVSAKLEEIKKNNTDDRTALPPGGFLARDVARRMCDDTAKTLQNKVENACCSWRKKLQERYKKAQGGAIFNKWCPAELKLRPHRLAGSAYAIVLIAQAKTGVIGRLGGIKFGESTDCPLCGAANALGRNGKTVEHAFECSAAADYRKESLEGIVDENGNKITEFTPALLFTHPIPSANYLGAIVRDVNRVKYSKMKEHKATRPAAGKARKAKEAGEKTKRKRDAKSGADNGGGAALVRYHKKKRGETSRVPDDAAVELDDEDVADEVMVEVAPLEPKKRPSWYWRPMKVSRH